MPQQKTIWTTADGRSFNSEQEAEVHEQKLRDREKFDTPILTWINGGFFGELPSSDDGSVYLCLGYVYNETELRWFIAGITNGDNKLRWKNSRVVVDAEDVILYAKLPPTRKG